jgi:hypothetical protein
MFCQIDDVQSLCRSGALQAREGWWVNCALPCRGAVLAGLAEKKPQLLEALTEGIFRRHSEFVHE